MRISLTLQILVIVLLSLQANAERVWRPKDTRHWTEFQALVRAVDSNDIHSVRQMISRGIDVDGHNVGDGFAPEDRPLKRAARRGSLEMVEILLKAGAEPDRCCCSCVTALHEAIRHQHIEVVRRLIDAGASVKLLCDGSTSPLHLARQTGNEEIARIISEKLAMMAPAKRQSVDGGVEQGVAPDGRSPAAPVRR